MSLSDRIHHRERIKAKFRRKQKLAPYWGDGPKSEGIYANHGCACSCWMCGNPRRHHGQKTIQERKASLPEPQFEDQDIASYAQDTFEKNR